MKKQIDAGREMKTKRNISWSLIKVKKHIEDDLICLKNMITTEILQSQYK
jgi:hypothetical protein